MSNVCWIIPARKGSKRVPFKNLQLLGNQTLITRAAQTFSCTGDKVIVATDSHEIAHAVSNIKNVHVIMRSLETSTDIASSESVIDEVLKLSNIQTEYVGLAQCTTPFIAKEEVEKANKLMSMGYDNIISVFEKPYFVWNRDGEAFFDKQERKRTQEHGIFIENGGFYVFKREKYKGSRFVEGNTAFVVMSERRSLEIDSIDDLNKAKDIAKTTGEGQ
jgi:CMP-N-acetylneuraminic acid synthetase